MNTKHPRKTHSVKPPINFDDCLPHRQSDHTKHITVSQLKAERLRVLNERRAANGLPPIQ
jgi:hypothetical protein